MTQPQQRQRDLWWVLGVVLAAVAAAVGAVALLKSLGVGPQIQRLVAFAVVGVPLLLLTVRRSVGPQDALSTATALTALAALMVAALTYVGSVDADPAAGCLNTNGKIEVTTSKEPTVVFAEATAATEAKTMLLRGCELRGNAWCVGVVHTDAIEGNVFDSRWLVLSGGQGLVPVGHTVGPPLPDDERDDNCKGGVRPPDQISFSRALVDGGSGAVGVYARADRAAFIGFAIQRAQKRWQRLGWDYKPSDDEPVALPAPLQASAARVGDRVAAVACLGLQQAAMSGGSPLTQDAVVAAGGRVTPDSKRVAAVQPVESSAEAAACNSSVPIPPSPYEPGTIGKGPRR